MLLRRSNVGGHKECGNKSVSYLVLFFAVVLLSSLNSFAQSARKSPSIFTHLPRDLGNTSQQCSLVIQFWLTENVDSLCLEMSKMSEDRKLSLDSVRNFKTRLWLTNSVEATLQSTVASTQTRVQGLEDLVRKPTVSPDLRKQTEENLKYAQALLTSLKFNIDKVASLRVQVQDLEKKCEDWEQVWEATLPIVGLDEMRKQLRGQIVADRDRFKEWAESDRGLDLRKIRTQLDGVGKKEAK